MVDHYLTTKFYSTACTVVLAVRWSPLLNQSGPTGILMSDAFSPPSHSLYGQWEIVLTSRKEFYGIWTGESIRKSAFPYIYFAQR